MQICSVGGHFDPPPRYVGLNILSWANIATILAAIKILWPYHARRQEIRNIQLFSKESGDFSTFSRKISLDSNILSDYWSRYYRKQQILSIRSLVTLRTKLKLLILFIVIFYAFEIFEMFVRNFNRDADYLRKIYSICCYIWLNHVLIRSTHWSGPIKSCFQLCMFF